MAVYLTSRDHLHESLWEMNRRVIHRGKSLHDYITEQISFCIMIKTFVSYHRRSSFESQKWIGAILYRERIDGIPLVNFTNLEII